MGFILAALLTPVLQAKTKTINFVGDFFPILLEKNEKDQICGIGPSIIKALTESMGCGFTLETVPISRGLKMVQLGSKDAIISLYKTEEREKYLQYTSTPYYTDSMRIYSLKDSKIPWNGRMESLRPYRIGAMQGWYYTNRFKSLKKSEPRYQFDWIPIRVSGFKMLQAKRIDVLLSNERNLQYYMQQPASKNSGKEQDIVALEPVFETQGLYMAFSTQFPSSVLQDFDKALTKFIKDGKVQELIKAPTASCLP